MRFFCRRGVTLLAVSLAGIGFGLADAQVTAHTRTEFGGAMGQMFNTFGGKAAREGVTTIESVKGDRKLDRTGDNGILVDLAEEKIYTIEFDKQRYSVMTFEEYRQQMREALDRAKQASGESAPKQGGPEYEIDVDVKETDAKRTLAGHPCKDTVVTIVARKKGMTLEAGGGTVLTTTMCMGPKLPELAAIDAFNVRYAKAIALDGAIGESAMQMAQMLGQNPSIAKVMKALRDKQSAFDGSPLATVMRIETVADPNAASGSEGDQGGASLGGMAGKFGKMFGKKKSDGGETKSQGSAQGSGERRLAMTTEREVRTIASSVPADAVAVPASFKKR